MHRHATNTISLDVKKTLRASRHTLVLLAVIAVYVSVVLVASVPAAAATLYVDRNNSSCTNSGSGTVQKPYCTISAAALKATSGQTVEVASGTYTEGVTPKYSGTSTSPIIYIAAPGAQVTVTGATHGFYLSSKKYVTVKGFSVTKTTGVGIRVASSSNITIANNNVSYAGAPVLDKTAKGILLNSTTNSVVVNNVTHHNTDAGIAVSNASTGNTISGNESYSNARQYVRAAAGIDLRDSPNNTVSGNKLHDNEDSGLNIWSSSNYSLAYNNVVYRNGDHGIDVHNVTDASVIANTVHKNVDSGIEATGSLRTLLANNISTDNGINSPRTSGNIRTDATSAASITLDYDLVSLSSPGVMVDWAGKKYASLSEFKLVVGQETNGIEAAPQFADPSTDNYRLTLNSPAVDSANSAASGHPLADADGSSRIDILSVINTGSGIRTYDDRGAYELQQ